MAQRAQLARLLVALAAFSCLSNALPSKCIRGLLVLNTQSDIDVLWDCAETSYVNNIPLGSETFKGDVMVGPNITGTFTLANYGRVNGSAIAENNPALEKIVLLETKGYLGQMFNALIVRNIPQLKSFVLEKYSPGVLQSNVSFHNLPTLEDLDVGPLVSVRRIDLVNLPRLTYLTETKREVVPFLPPGPRHLNIDNVGFFSIDGFFETTWCSGDRNTPLSTYRARGLPNVYNLTFSLAGADSVEIQGNGQLAMSIQNGEGTCGITPSEFSMEFGNLLVSGLSELSRYWRHDTSFRSKRQEVGSLRLGNFTAVANNFTSLSLDFEGLRGLHVVDNPKLDTLLFRLDAAAQYDWTNIVITGNPLLKLNSTVSTQSSNRTLVPSLIWPARDTSSMVFEGSFDNAFFQPFIDLGTDKAKRPRVLKKFSVTSSQPLNCSKLNELRKLGVLKGEYSCQGQTVADESRAGRDIGLGIGSALTIAAILWGL
ncbi:hypothetical protein B0T18DRAFT_139642 [Schizothecium vesticola]|uniref:Uncharacterized protein n=1 Tax=Schizothecium vesticola TaxID=314040 RepID=A0AA40EUQ6_9PEZI|nr:hypothetical protein B0T18DRAFT_139642 [Schizothecium vesticola]